MLVGKKTQGWGKRSLVRIGAAASEAGVSRQSLQYYVMVGLVKPSGKSPSGQRLFDGESIKRIKLIRKLNRSGYTLRDIREIFLTGKKSTGKK